MVFADTVEDSNGHGLQQEESTWVWLLDLERSLALAVGRCLGGMLQGPLVSFQEKTSEFWLSNILFRNGLEMNFEQLGRSTSFVGLLVFTSFNLLEIIELFFFKMLLKKNNIIQIIILFEIMILYCRLLYGLAARCGHARE